MDTATLEHTKHQANRVKGNDIEEILKVMRGYGENFTANGKTKAERRLINQQYLPLNPEALEKVPVLIDFLLHGTMQKGYSFPQKALLVEEIMTPEGTEKFKQALFSHLKLKIDGRQVYKALETYNTDLFSRAHPTIAIPEYVVNLKDNRSISNDRILTFTNDKKEKLYLRSRRNGFLYAEPHLKSYTGDAPDVEIFTTEIQLKNTLRTEWESLGRQIERIEEEHSNLITETRRIKEVLHQPKELEEVLTNMRNYTKQHFDQFSQEIGRTVEKIKTLTAKRAHRENIQLMIDHLIRQAELRLAESVAKREYLGQFLEQINTDPRFREGRNEKGEKEEEKKSE
ncbi:MAG: hypothetical protein LBD11_07165 [Candidatus Peribacteria bacterium]|jgi:hypothetical protein|nr:hypothetical protein [Candidatus Peribacteria bacterium]